MAPTSRPSIGSAPTSAWSKRCTAPAWRTPPPARRSGGDFFADYGPASSGNGVRRRRPGHSAGGHARRDRRHATAPPGAAPATAPPPRPPPQRRAPAPTARHPRPRAAPAPPPPRPANGDPGAPVLERRDRVLRARRRPSPRTWRPASRSRRRRRCAGRRPSCSRSTGRSLNNHLERAAAAARSASPTSSAGRRAGASRRCRDEHQLRRGRRQARRRPPPPRQPRPRRRRRASPTAPARSLVPNIKDADTLDFAGFLAAYEDLIRRVRAGKLAADDFAGTTVTLTNPGTIGTVHSVPRLMPGQGVIVGVGTIDYPAEYEGADPRPWPASAWARSSRSRRPTTTASSRAPRAASSSLGPRAPARRGGLLRRGLRQPRVPYEPARWMRDTSPVDDADGRGRQAGRASSSSSTSTGCAATSSPTSTRSAAAGPTRTPSSTRLLRASRIWDLDREFPTGGLGRHRQDDAAARHPRHPARRLLPHGRRRVHAHPGARPEGVDPAARRGRRRRRSPPADKRRILERLNAAEAFERFLHTKYLGHKRFGLEGAESLIPMLDAAARRRGRRRHGRSGAGHGAPRPAQRARQHRRQVATARSSGSSRATSTRGAQGSGDVKYHLGRDRHARRRPAATRSP